MLLLLFVSGAGIHACTNPAHRVYTLLIGNARVVPFRRKAKGMPNLIAHHRETRIELHTTLTFFFKHVSIVPLLEIRTHRQRDTRHRGRCRRWHITRVPRRWQMLIVRLAYTKMRPPCIIAGIDFVTCGRG